LLTLIVKEETYLRRVIFGEQKKKDARHRLQNISKSSNENVLGQVIKQIDKKSEPVTQTFLKKPLQIESSSKIGSKNNMVKDDIPEPSVMDVSRRLIVENEEDVESNTDEAIIHSDADAEINRIPETIVVKFLNKSVFNFSSKSSGLL
jgi:hypothetical protein